jgi:hypothetical protein
MRISYENAATYHVWLVQFNWNQQSVDDRDLEGGKNSCKGALHVIGQQMI